MRTGRRDVWSLELKAEDQLEDQEGHDNINNPSIVTHPDCRFGLSPGCGVGTGRGVGTCRVLSGVIRSLLCCGVAVW